ncbi:MAG: hypothetical protein JOZ81_07680 [Chloroflexi bacterium]|nr:hypothetical protein [Chloroflexota bacterium]
MSVYGVHKFLKRAQRDDALCAAVMQDAGAALREFPLSDKERAALLAGDVLALNRMGVHGYLLQTLARRKLFGLTPEAYIQRMHAPV